MGLCVHSEVADSNFVSLPRGGMLRARAPSRWRGRGAAGGSGIERWGLRGGEEGKDEERGRWHRLPRCQVAAGTRQPSRNICRLPRKRAQERTTDFSSLLSREPKGPSSPTQTGTVGVSRAQFLISYLFRKRAAIPLAPSPFPFPSLPVAITSVSFIPAACSKIFNFGRWHVPNGSSLSSSPFSSPLLLLLCRVSPMKLLARDKLVNWKRETIGEERRHVPRAI